MRRCQIRKRSRCISMAKHQHSERRGRILNLMNSERQFVILCKHNILAERVPSLGHEQPNEQNVKRMIGKNKFLYLLIPILNSFLFFLIPEYYFWFAVILSIGAFICLVIIVIDILGKTDKWKDALKILGLGAASYILGILLIVIRNYFLGYYSN